MTNPGVHLQDFVRGAPQLSRQVLLGWADKVLVS